MNDSLERLQKVIARSGVTSRRKAEQLIVDGRVKVNGKIVKTLGVKVSPKDKVVVDGIPLEKEQLVYYVLYKPIGYISAVSDDRGRKTVIDLFPGVEERIFPIGRLDYHTSGVLLLTNDGEFAHQLMHPKFAVDKVYLAKVTGIPSKKTLEQLLSGVRDGKDVLKAAHYKLDRVDRRRNVSYIEITLHEGKNRHIRRMFEQIGHPVEKLTRLKYGIIDLKKLQPGAYRTLTPHEVHVLRRISLKNVKQ